MFVLQKSFAVQWVSGYVGGVCVVGWMWKVPAECWTDTEFCAASHAGSDAMVKKATRYFKLWKFLFFFSLHVIARTQNHKAWAPLDYRRQEWLCRPYAPWARRTFHRRIIQVSAFPRLGHSTGLWTYSLLSVPWQNFCPRITDWHGVPLSSYAMGYKENVTQARTLVEDKYLK